MNTIRYMMDAQFTARTTTGSGRRLAVQLRGKHVVVLDECTKATVRSFDIDEYTDAVEFIRRHA